MDSINNVNKIATKIGQHLEKCIEDVKKMLREQRKLIRILHDNVIFQLSNTRNGILNRFTTVKNEIFEFYNSEKLSSPTFGP